MKGQVMKSRNISDVHLRAVQSEKIKYSMLFLGSRDNAG
jgi:hypothetical protein